MVAWSTRATTGLGQGGEEGESSTQLQQQQRRDGNDHFDAEMEEMGRPWDKPGPDLNELVPNMHPTELQEQLVLLVRVLWHAGFQPTTTLRGWVRNAPGYLRRPLHKCRRTGWMIPALESPSCTWEAGLW